MFIIHTRVASCLFPREVPSNSPFECKVTEGVSGHAADFLLFSKRRATGPSYGKFIHMPHLRALRGCSLLSSKVDAGIMSQRVLWVHIQV